MDGTMNRIIDQIRTNEKKSVLFGAPGGDNMEKKEAVEWVKQEGSGFWKPTQKGEELVGEVVDIKEGTYGTQYVVEQANREQVIIPSYKVLLARMNNVEKNDMVKIVYLGEEAPKLRGYNPTKLFEVFVRKK